MQRSKNIVCPTPLEYWVALKQSGVLMTIAYCNVISHASLGNCSYMVECLLLKELCESGSLQQGCCLESDSVLMLGAFLLLTLPSKLLLGFQVPPISSYQISVLSNLVFAVSLIANTNLSRECWTRPIKLLALGSIGCASLQLSATEVSGTRPSQRLPLPRL